MVTIKGFALNHDKILQIYFFSVKRKPTFRYMSKAEYSQTSIARTSLGPQKFVLDMDSSNHLGLIIAPGQEVTGDKLEMSSIK